MCLALPGLVMSVRDEEGSPVALVDFDGVTREVSIAFVPDARPGDYLIVHAGVAIQLLDEEAAAETLAALGSLGPPPGDEP